MKLCDKCYHTGEYRPGAVPVVIGVEEAELCNSCAEEIRALIWSPPKQQESKKNKK